jgi:hypothetical protein
MKLILILFGCLFILGCGKISTPEPNQPFDHFINDFENKNLNGFHFLTKDSSINTQLDSITTRKGKYALKNTLFPEDYVNNGYRSELAVYNCAKYKTDVYYGFSFQIDENYIDQAYNLICQWQDLPNYNQGEDWGPSPTLHGSPPPISLTYVDNQLEIKMNDSPNSSDKTFLVGDAIPIVKSKWYDVVAHIFWNDDSTAFIEIWLNGQLITPFNGTDYKYYHRNLFNRAGNYFKFGQYRGKDKTAHSNTVYFDEIKIGSSYSEVCVN